MSYDIYIGKAELSVPSKSDLEDGYNHLSVSVNGMALPDAPTFPGDGMTKNGNSRHPGYSQWSEFCRRVGLYDLFFDNERGLIREHPGCFVLTKGHADEIHDALEKWQKDHPKLEPGWCECTSKECASMMGNKDAKHVERDPALARLIWLDWWVRWALKNCEVPAMANH